MMKSRKLRSAGLTVAGLFVVAAAWVSIAPGQEGTEDQDLADPQLLLQASDDGRRSFGAVHVTNMGDKRMVWMQKGGSTGGGAHEFTAAQEMDVEKIIIANGTWANNRPASFGFWIHDDAAHRFAASSGEFGTTTITLPFPMPIREGEWLSYGYYTVQGESSPGVVQLTFLGTIPGEGTDSLSVH